MTNIRLQFMLHAKFMVSALSRIKTIKLLCLYHESIRNSVKARVHNNRGVSFSQTPIAFAGDLDFVRNSEWGIVSHALIEGTR